MRRKRVSDNKGRLWRFAIVYVRVHDVPRSGILIRGFNSVTAAGRYARAETLQAADDCAKNLEDNLKQNVFENLSAAIWLI